MNRRRFLKSIAAFGATLGAASRLPAGQGAGATVATTAAKATVGPEAVGGLTASEWATLRSLADRLLPAVPGMPAASVLGALDYLKQALGEDYKDLLPEYRRLLGRIEGLAGPGLSFVSLPADRADAAILELSRLEPAGFGMLRQHVLEGCFADPVHGGNRSKSGWAAIKLAEHQH